MKTDGGATWTTIYSGSSYDDFYSVVFTNENTGYISTGGAVLKTTDGGATWVSSLTSGGLTFYSLYFSNATTGYVCGANGFIYLTTDGGTTWNNQPAGTLRALHAICITASNSGFAAGESGTILTTTNGGVGITNKSQENKIRIYPNPAQDIITIETEVIMQGGNVTIINPEGQELMSRQITGKRTRLNTGNLPGGIYFVKVSDNKTIRVGKIIKE